MGEENRRIGRQQRRNWKARALFFKCAACLIAKVRAPSCECLREPLRAKAAGGARAIAPLNARGPSG